MKKIIVIAVLLLSVHNSFACDICGCSSGNYFIGPFPNFYKHFFGVRYSFRSFNSMLANDHTQYSKDFYQSVELWGGLTIRRRWQLIGFVPYNINKQNSDDGSKKSNGLGDISLIANYKFFDRKSVSNHGNKISQKLWLGAGLKLPTGKFAAVPDDIIADANNQPGTGTLDLILNAMYSLEINKWGISSNANYKINSSADKFRFGNRFNASCFVFRSLSYKKKTFNPNAGVFYENLQGNKLDKSKIEDTGGNTLLAAAGLETHFEKITVGFNTQLPVSQNLSDGQTKTKLRGMLHITFAF